MIGSAIGCVLGLWIQRKLGWNSKQMIMLHLAALMCLAWYALLGVIPGSPIGLVSKGELYVFGLIYALQFGSITSFSRSTFASIVPIGKESAMFALYEVTDKGSSWIGPLAMSIISNYASLRWGMVYCSSFFVVSLPILWFKVNIQEGMEQAGRSRAVAIEDKAGKEQDDDVEKEQGAQDGADKLEMAVSSESEFEAH